MGAYFQKLLDLVSSSQLAKVDALVSGRRLQYSMISGEGGYKYDGVKFEEQKE